MPLWQNDGDSTGAPWVTFLTLPCSEEGPLWVGAVAVDCPVSYTSCVALWAVGAELGHIQCTSPPILPPEPLGSVGIMLGLALPHGKMIKVPQHQSRFKIYSCGQYHSHSSTWHYRNKQSRGTLTNAHRQVETEHNLIGTMAQPTEKLD